MAKRHYKKLKSDMEKQEVLLKEALEKAQDVFDPGHTKINTLCHRLFHDNVIKLDTLDTRRRHRNEEYQTYFSIDLKGNNNVHIDGVFNGCVTRLKCKSEAIQETIVLYPPWETKLENGEWAQLITLLWGERHTERLNSILNYEYFILCLKRLIQGYTMYKNVDGELFKKLWQSDTRYLSLC